MTTSKALEQNFKKHIKKGALGHAYAIYGPDAIAQFALARALANFLETCEAGSGEGGRWEEPSTVLIDGRFVDGAKEGMGVDQARSFIDFLYRTPARSSHRTLVVANASELTAQAQNAILKLVEEPPLHGLIILTVKDPNSLLPTLRSRLEMIYLTGSEDNKQSDTDLDLRARELVEEFLLARADGRKQILKKMIDSDKEDSTSKEQRVADAFLSHLIIELAKRPKANLPVLQEALKRQQAIGDYSVNKKLQLEAVMQFLS